MLQARCPYRLSYSTDDINAENRKSYTFKKFLSAAVHVEKSFKKMTKDNRKISKRWGDSIKFWKTKRCTCVDEVSICSYHLSMTSEDELKCTKSEPQTNFQSRNGIREQKGIQNTKQKETLKTKEPLLIPKLDLKPKRPKSKPSSLGCNTSKTPLKPPVDHLKDRSSKTDSPEVKTIFKNNKKKQKDKNQNAREKVEEWVKDIKQSEQLFDPEEEPIVPVENNNEYNVLTDDDRSVCSGSSSASSKASSMITVRRSMNTFRPDEMRLSLSPATSVASSENDSVKLWLNKKNEEERMKRLAEKQREKRRQIEREKILHHERENFKIWLAAQKRKDEMKKAESERQRQLDQLRELEKQKRRLENEIRFQLWTKEKEEAKIGQRNEAELKKVREQIEREQRTIANQKAFQEWLEVSKSKPKPIPFGRGLDSLRSSVSVTYVNPIPWVPNIDPKPQSK